VAEIKLTITDEAIEAIAARAAELVLEQIGREPETSPYLSVAEAADYLRSSKQRVYDLLSSGRVTRRKDGARVLVERAELDRYLASNGSKGVAPPLPTTPRARTGSGVQR
jgi:excisionase family DNA binding protein